RTLPATSLCSTSWPGLALRRLMLRSWAWAAENGLSMRMAAGEIDSISNLDPVITRLQQDGTGRVVADTRFPRVNYEIFGGTNPPAVLYAKQDFIAANPATIQALVNAFYKTLRWIATATTDEIINSVPPEYFFGDRAIYVKALKANLLVYSRTGIIT